MIKTTDELVAKIAEDLIWRRKELTELKALVQVYKDDILRSRVLIRAAVALLYAHWEGFVKKSSSYYVEYVASHRLPYRKLAANFVGLTLRSKFSELGVSEKISGGNALADFFCNKLDNKSNVPYRKVVDTKSNLSSTVLLDIISALGLDASQFSTHLNFIDTNLVNLRNHIAHGNALGMNVDSYLELHDQVVSLIATYRNVVENAAISRRFERHVVEMGDT